MKTYKVAVFEEQGGFIYIKANNSKEAEERAEDILNEEGITGEHDFNVKHRDTSVGDVEEINATL